MITAFVQIPILPSLRHGEIVQLFTQIAPDFRRPEGLIRKYFVISDDGRTAGGVYLWRSRVLAIDFYESGFRQHVAQLFGSQPNIAYFDTPLVVDNLSGEIVKSPLASARVTATGAL